MKTDFTHFNGPTGNLTVIVITIIRTVAVAIVVSGNRNCTASLTSRLVVAISTFMWNKIVMPSIHICTNLNELNTNMSFVITITLPGYYN